MAEKQEIELSIIIPFRNEEKRIENTIKEIDEFIDKSGLNCEVILSDSHSSDKSIEIAKKYAEEIDHYKYIEPKGPVNRGGKGQAVKLGICAAKGRLIMFMDADSSTKITEIEKLLPYIEEYDIVTGSRYIKETRPYESNYFKSLFRGIKSVIEVLIFGHSKDYMAKGKQGRIRQFVSRGGNLAFSVLLNQSYVDQRCGFKLYKAQVAKFLAGLQRISDWGFDTEYWAIAQKYKFKIIEVPVEWYDEAGGTKINPIKDTYTSFRDIFKVQWNLITGRYSRKNAKKKLGNLYEEYILND